MAKVMFTARIEQEEEEFLKSLGGGDRTAGFRLLLSRSMGAPAPAPAVRGRPTVAAPAPVRRTAQVPSKPLARVVPVQAPAAPARRTGFVGKR